MLGDLITRLDQPDVAAEVVASLGPIASRRLERRAEELSMAPADFASGAVREFFESADDDLWFQLLTLIRKAEDPGLVAVQTILRWVVTPE
jgi:hypothetical protein